MIFMKKRIKNIVIYKNVYFIYGNDLKIEYDANIDKLFDTLP